MRRGPAQAQVGAAVPAVITNGQPAHSRERILVYGKEGAGKTNNWMSIAEAYPEVPFFCADTDDSVQRLLETQYEDIKNIEYVATSDWATLDRTIDAFIAKIIAYNAAHPPKRKEDYPWLIVDFSDTTWDMVQTYFIEQVFSKDADQYFIEKRKSIAPGAKQGNTFEGWIDWPVINKIFQQLWTKISTGNAPFHLYITAKSKQPESIEEQTLYRHLKAAPVGEKRMPHRVHSVLLSTVDQNGWYLSSAKDRGRPLLRNALNRNFAITYLMRVAGWER